MGNFEKNIPQVHMGKKKNPVQVSLRSKNKIYERTVGWKNNSGKMLPELTP